MLATIAHDRVSERERSVGEPLHHVDDTLDIRQSIARLEARIDGLVGDVLDVNMKVVCLVELLEKNNKLLRQMVRLCGAEPAA
ncbi:MAG: hypothetical protein IPO81_09450 [Kouleothrix sp.]|nr:hypothetical protein [Kouleothrix sp.]